MAALPLTQKGVDINLPLETNANADGGRRAGPDRGRLHGRPSADDQQAGSADRRRAEQVPRALRDAQGQDAVRHRRRRRSRTARSWPIIDAAMGAGVEKVGIVTDGMRHARRKPPALAAKKLGRGSFASRGTKSCSSRMTRMAVLILGLRRATAGCGKYSISNIRSARWLPATAPSMYKSARTTRARPRRYEQSIRFNPEFGFAYFFLGNSYDKQFKPARRRATGQRRRPPDMAVAELPAGDRQARHLHRTAGAGQISASCRSSI